MQINPWILSACSFSYFQKVCLIQIKCHQFWRNSWVYTYKETLIRFKSIAILSFCEPSKDLTRFLYCLADFCSLSWKPANSTATSIKPRVVQVREAADLRDPHAQHSFIWYKLVGLLKSLKQRAITTSWRWKLGLGAPTPALESFQGVGKLFVRDGIRLLFYSETSVNMEREWLFGGVYAPAGGVQCIFCEVICMPLRCFTCKALLYFRSCLHR